MYGGDPCRDHRRVFVLCKFAAKANFDLEKWPKTTAGVFSVTFAAGNFRDAPVKPDIASKLVAFVRFCSLTEKQLAV
jgi:hypothetical protein